MQTEISKQQIFAIHLRNARFEEMTSMLRCKLCTGLLRFAHTLVECGHTFCHHCIFTYINSFRGRNPEVKCPQCHINVQNTFSRSVVRDVFKQNLVDLLDPSYVAREKMIIERIRRLFPQFNLSFLLEEYCFPSQDSHRKKRSEKNRILVGLLTAIRNKLGLTIQEFSEQISVQSSFQLLLLRKMPETEKQPVVIDIRPRNQQDYRLVGINNKIQVVDSKVAKLRKFLEKRALLRLQTHEQLAREVLEGDNSRLEVRVELVIEDKILDDDQQMGEGEWVDEPIFYQFRRI